MGPLSPFIFRFESRFTYEHHELDPKIIFLTWIRWISQTSFSGEWRMSIRIHKPINVIFRTMRTICLVTKHTERGQARTENFLRKGMSNKYIYAREIGRYIGLAPSQPPPPPSQTKNITFLLLLWEAAKEIYFFFSGSTTNAPTTVPPPKKTQKSCHL